MEKEITIKDLLGASPVEDKESKMKQVSIETILPFKKEDEEELNTPVTEFVGMLDAVEAEYEEKAKEIVSKKKEEAKAQSIIRQEQAGLRELDYMPTEASDDFTDAPVTPSSVVVRNEEDTHYTFGHDIKEEEEELDNMVAVDEDEDDETDFKDMDKEIEDIIEDKALDNDTAYNILKTKIKEKIKPFTKKIDLASFTVATGAVSAHEIFVENVNSNKRTGDWALFTTGVPITMECLTGHELDLLQSVNKGQFKSVKQSLRILYDHIVNPNKPKFETWVKLVNAVDEEDLYFAAHAATFQELNTFPYECPTCHEVFLNDSDPIKMVEWESDEIKKELTELVESTETIDYNGYEVERVQISDEIVIDFKCASIFSAILEPMALPQQLREKYLNQLGIISYIENIFKIDYETNSLVPIKLETYPNEFSKTVLFKVQAFAKILKTLNSDQKFYLNGIITSIDAKTTRNVSYKIPETVCPVCGKKISADYRSARDILFIRHGLSAIANM